VLKQKYLVLLILLTILLIDQSLKIWVKLNMTIGDSFNVFGDRQSWCQIYFVENPGMAWGIEWGQGWGKLALSLFRLTAIVLMGIYITRLLKKRKSLALIIGVTFIMAGALGNMLDGMFYGLFFTNSEYRLASLVELGEGYGHFLHGYVVDMFYFPLFEGTFPNWLPWFGGSEFQFFNAIFNVADAAVFIGVVILLIFHRQFMNELSTNKKMQEPIPVISNNSLSTYHDNDNELKEDKP